MKTLKILRWPLAVILIAGVFYWAAAYFERLQERSDLLTAVDEDREVPIAELEQLPASRDKFQTLAERAEFGIFPPDYQAAAEYSKQAIRLDPLRSDLWLHLARQQFFLNQTGGARASLERSDELDPNYPRQRVEAIRLWTLLGHEERALGLATQISILSPVFRREAVRELILTGWQPAEIFQTLDLGELETGELAELLPLLRKNSTEQMDELLEKIPKNHFSDPEFVTAALQLAVQPVIWDQATTLWRLASPNLEFTEIGEKRVPLANPHLTEAPFAETSPLGWQAPREIWGTYFDWIPPQNLAKQHGALRLTIETRDKDAYHWNFYRMLVPAGVPIRVTLRIRKEPANRSICTFRAIVDRSPAGSVKSSWSDEGWQDLTIEIPPQESACMATLTFTREVRGGRNPDPVHIYFGELLLDEGEATGPENE